MLPGLLQLNTLKASRQLQGAAKKSKNARQSPESLEVILITSLLSKASKNGQETQNLSAFLCLSSLDDVNEFRLYDKILKSDMYHHLSIFDKIHYLDSQITIKLKVMKSYNLP